jgi:hypothetical protein
MLAPVRTTRQACAGHSLGMKHWTSVVRIAKPAKVTRTPNGGTLARRPDFTLSIENQCRRHGHRRCEGAEQPAGAEMISLLAGRSPCDSEPGFTDAATDWLESVMAEPEGRPIRLAD